MKVLPYDQQAILKAIARTKADLTTLSRMLRDTGISVPGDRWQVALMMTSAKLSSLKAILEGLSDLPLMEIEDGDYE